MKSFQRTKATVIRPQFPNIEVSLETDEDDEEPNELLVIVRVASAIEAQLGGERGDTVSRQFRVDAFRAAQFSRKHLLDVVRRYVTLIEEDDE